MIARLSQRCGLVLAGLSGLALAPPAPPATLEAVLALPLSAGAAALLVPHAADPRVQARWSEALKDTSPLVRASAVRAINVTATLSLVPEVAAALASETDFDAAVEEVEALAALGGPARQGDLRAAAQRDARLRPVVALALAVPRDPPRPSTGPPSTWRTPSGFPPGLIAEVMRVSGCSRRAKDAYHGGRVLYGSDGRPREVTMLAGGRVGPGCAEAVTALLYLGMAAPAPEEPGGHVDLVIVPLAAAAVACMEEPHLSPAADAAAIRVGGEIREPKKVRHVNPWYPDDAKNDRAQGTVVLEAVIAPSGCVQGVKLLRSAHPQLDVASLVTVAQWAYTPTLLNGVPVSVIMTVTVNFRLS